MTKPQDDSHPPFVPPEIILDKIVAPADTILFYPDHEDFRNPTHFAKLGKTRDWWTPYFYNCLPIVFGNQHGFVMLSTYDFVVRWDGDESIAGVLVHPLEKLPEHNLILIDSHFGSGIVTVQSRYAFRTPPGVNLMVKEPPNYFVNGLTWMNAVVESDNLRRDFTFNIKITRPNMDIFVPKGTPLGCIVPYPRYFLDNYKMEELKDPELLAEAWRTLGYISKERAEFDHGVPRKRYMEGIDAYNLEFKEHQKSLDMGQWWHSLHGDQAPAQSFVMPAGASASSVPTAISSTSPTSIQSTGPSTSPSASDQSAPKQCPFGGTASPLSLKGKFEENSKDKSPSDTSQTSERSKYTVAQEEEVSGFKKVVDKFFMNMVGLSLSPMMTAWRKHEEAHTHQEVIPSAESHSKAETYKETDQLFKPEEFKEIVELNADLPDKTLTLFLPPDYDKSLAPVKANRLRNWWEKDAKTKDHARFCLPLTMAAGLGWYILSPATFRIEWDGNNEHDVKIDIVDGSSHAVIDNHSTFGSFTIQARFIPRTKRPGDFVYIKSLANEYRLPFYLLEGMVEAWWTPSNFGLVCMMNQPGKFIIKKGDPIGQMFVINAEQGLYDMAFRDGYPPGWQEWDEKRSSPSYTGRNMDYFKGLWPDGTEAHPHLKSWSKHDAADLLEEKHEQAAPEAGIRYPLFDQNIDGPILDSAKTMEIATSAGMIHIILDPDLAPITATQLHKLLKLGVFNGTPFVRHEANFLLQTAVAEQKAGGHREITAKARALLRRLPLEVDAQKQGAVLHKKFVVGMGRDDEPDSAVSSFSIMLADSPHLDGKYTIFGRLVPDRVTTDTITNIIIDFPRTQPIILSAKEI
jgi:cyclophilin family peptidyl-prolyl cis-trans isomerase